MSGDYSRQRFDPKKDYSGVLMQQGRVQLDSDWNELVSILDRRLRAQITDIVGRCVVARETPEGFQIKIGAGNTNTLTIGLGRMYVDGLLAENRGKEPFGFFDAVLGELRGTKEIFFNDQPHFPNVATQLLAPPHVGPRLVYLDVWQREVTHVQEPDLIEKAVGVDTTARLQTVWQVKILDVDRRAACGSKIAAWNTLIAPSAGRLSTTAVGLQAASDPCLIPPSGGYRGLDNRLYRVEIQDGGEGGEGGAATFKWSRDNASVEAGVLAIPEPNKLSVASIGRDSVMRFKRGDWIEVINDRLEFARQPGVKPVPLGVIRQVENVDESNRILTLTSELPGAYFQIDDQDTVTANHTRVRRWDQSGQVHDTHGNLIADLNAQLSKGSIPVPAAGTSIILEDGVQITFETPADGVYHIGDYWNFAARTADASVEELVKAPPRGVHHHFCRLALVTPDDVTDCRTLWPPEIAGEGCECTVCVSADSHKRGTLTIQRAIDQVKTAGGGTVCLGAGFYDLGEAPTPINISNVPSLTLRGQGAETLLSYSGLGPAIAINGCSSGVTIEKLKLVTSASEGDMSPSPAVSLTNSTGVIVQRCDFGRQGSEESPAIGLGGVLERTTIRENSFLCKIGIGNLPSKGQVVGSAKTAPLVSGSLDIYDNALNCSSSGIHLVGISVHASPTRLTNNFISGCAEGGIVLTGFVSIGSSIDVQGNDLRVNGQGLVIGANGTRVTNNSITSFKKKGGDGIVLMAGLDPDGLDQCHVIGNRITAIKGIGISILGKVKSGMIKNNFIDGVVGGGIIMGEKSSAETLAVENNQIQNVTALPIDDHATSMAGIRLVDVNRGDIFTNAIAAVGLESRSQRCLGIQLIASTSVRVSGNDIVDIGPPVEGAISSAGIESVGTFDELGISNNKVKRSRTTTQGVDEAEWYAVRISGARATPSRPSRRGAIHTIFGTTTNLSFALMGDRILARPLGRESLLLQSNHLEGYGRTPVVHLDVHGPCTFNDNQCFLRGASQPAVWASATSAIVNANHVHGGKPTIDLTLLSEGPFTLIGNITTNAIWINSLELAGPWAPLNMRLS